MKTLNSAELASAARRAAGPGGCRGSGCLWLHSLPALPRPHPCFFLLPVPAVFEWRKQQVALSLPILERTVNISSEYIQITLSAQGLQSVVSLDSHCISRFLLTASICPENRMMALCIPWSHSRDFCSEESRCDDNHTHLKWLKAYRAKLCSVLFRFNNV